MEHTFSVCVAYITMKLILLLICAIFTVSAKKGFGPGDQEWGFSEVRPGAHMFWWLYYTTHPGKSTERPLVLWLQGGPGASSTGYGNFEELGPLDPNLKPRNYSWVKDCNVMFVDNPVGTGWSHVKSSSLLTKTNKQIALDLVNMMKDFYTKFPKFEETALYVTCESYGGKMVAEFALELDAAIKRGEIRSNFKGVGLGDSWISPIDSVMTWAPYLLEFGMVDQRGYDAINKNALLVRKAIENCEWNTATNEWSNTEGVILNEAYGVDFYNVLSKINYYRGVKRAIPVPGSKSKNSYSLSSIMNTDVRKALNLSSDIYWQEHNNAVFSALSTDFMKPVVHIVEKLLNSTNIKVAVFTGQLDLIVDTPGTVNWIENMNWIEKNNWVRSKRHPLLADGYVEGFVKKYNKFGLYWINRAGHMVPADNPAGMDAVLRDLTNNYTGK